MSVTDQAFVTLASNDIYCQGALVLGQSLRNHGTSRKLAVLVTEQVSHGIRTVLSRVFDEVIEVSSLDSADLEHLALMRRPELGVTFTKLQCWTLTQYSKCVFMDADTLVLCNVDELFDRDELSAAPDSGWPDCFNSGVFVFRPSMETYAHLLQFAVEHGSFDGGDQGLLNGFFSDWATTDISKHLPFIYNLSISSLYTYSPAFRQFGTDSKVVHFLGSSKPWHCKYNPQTRTVTEGGSPSGHQHLIFTTLWWEIYTSSVLPLLTGLEEIADTEGQEKHRFGGVEVVMKRKNPSPANVQSQPPAQHANPDCLDNPTNKIMHNKVREVGSLTPLQPGRRQGLSTSSHGSTSTHRSQAARGNPTATASSFQRAPSLQSTSSEAGNLEVSVCEPEPVPPSSATYVDIPASEPAPPSSPGILAASVTELSIQAAEEIEPRTEEERRKWEEGQMDYMGKDAFENIKKRLDRFLQ
ncbi:glycogenin-2 isoform X3 [Microcaecilia unicolor]|uniref:glycogenin glucosyltransferase n=1 Tax=Microcaecilia unicolor TaxID=1415580 RepID=A0A6P7XRC8_9AMPH|nr:glycogenin-2 isoform X3 [Microcaecilia unicolor]